MRLFSLKVDCVSSTMQIAADPVIAQVYNKQHLYSYVWRGRGRVGKTRVFQKKKQPTWGLKIFLGGNWVFSCLDL